MWKRLILALGFALSLVGNVPAITPPEAYGIGPDVLGLSSFYNIDPTNGNCTLIASGTPYIWTGLMYMVNPGKLWALTNDGLLFEFPPTAQGWNNPVQKSFTDVKATYSLNRCYGLSTEAGIMYFLGEDNTSTWLFKMDQFNVFRVDRIGKLSDNTNSYYAWLGGVLATGPIGNSVFHHYSGNASGYFYEVSKDTAFVTVVNAGSANKWTTVTLRQTPNSLWGICTVTGVVLMAQCDASGNAYSGVRLAIQGMFLLAVH